jgi:precorrin-8X/cobalt-precorrin-8 methylmutase
MSAPLHPIHPIDPIHPIHPIDPIDPIHPIEAESYRLLEERCDLSSFATGQRAVVARVLHATVDFSFAESLVVPEVAVEAGVAAVRAGAVFVADVEMVRAGISQVATECFLGAARALARDGAIASGITLSARAIQLAAEQHPVGAVFVVGCAPTALEQVIALAKAGVLHPALVIGVPVGLVGAAESKEHLREATSILSISNVGERGGSAVAAAIVNALVRLAAA